MSRPVPTIDVLREARKLVADEKTWAGDGGYAVNSDGDNTVAPNDPSACRYCAMGAIMKSMSRRGLDMWGLDKCKLENALDSIAKRLFGTRLFGMSSGGRPVGLTTAESTSESTSGEGRPLHRGRPNDPCQGERRRAQEGDCADAVPVELQDGERIQHAAEAIRYKAEIERLTKETWKLGSQFEERDMQLAREREAVDALLLVAEKSAADDDADGYSVIAKPMWDAIEAVRKSREGAPPIGESTAEGSDEWIAGALGRDPDDFCLVWQRDAVTGPQFRAASPEDAERAAGYLNASRSVGPRVVALPDAEGWWARKETRRVEWLYVEPIAETGDEGAPTVLSTWVSAFRRHFPIAEMSGPGIEWSGPFTLPEGWA